MKGVLRLPGIPLSQSDLGRELVALLVQGFKLITEPRHLNGKETGLVRVDKAEGISTSSSSWALSPREWEDLPRSVVDPNRSSGVGAR